MIVKNTGKRILILGDRVRNGNAPGKGTQINPEQEIDVDAMPKERKELFLKCVQRAILQGKELEILGEAGLSPNEIESKSREARASSVGKELSKGKDESEPKRGPGRPPKSESESK